MVWNDTECLGHVPNSIQNNPCSHLIAILHVSLSLRQTDSIQEIPKIQALALTFKF